MLRAALGNARHYVSELVDSLKESLTGRGCPSHRSVGVPGVSWNLAGPLDAGQRLGIGNRHPWQLSYLANGGIGEATVGNRPGVSNSSGRTDPCMGVRSFLIPCPKIVCRLLDGYNTTVKCYFPGRLPRSFLLLFFRQTLAVWELAVGQGRSGDLPDWMTCQEVLKRLERR
jgi:hypothetical protein